jgi:hypothetical protein
MEVTGMPIRKTFIAVLATAIAVAFSPLPELQAATLAGPGSQPSTSLVEQAKAKKKGYKKKAKKKKKGKRKKAKRAGKAASCGTFMYRKKGKCVDARNKK